MKLLNASQWPLHASSDGRRVQYAVGAHTPEALDALELMLEPARWSENYNAFAVVQVDNPSSRVVLVRDHFGGEPLYYYWDRQYCVFSSNLPDLLRQFSQLGLTEPELHQGQLKDLFSPRHTYSNQTFYQGIARVEPGSMVLLMPNQESPVVSYFWKLAPDAPDLMLAHQEDYLERFSDLMEQAMRLYATPEDQVMGELSGGLDSSSILVTAHRLGLQYPLVMHIAPPDSKERDDRVLADQLLAHLGIDADQWVSYVDAQDFDPETVFQKTKLLQSRVHRRLSDQIRDKSKFPRGNMNVAGESFYLSNF